MFTTQEYIDRYKLGVRIDDPHAMRILNAHLKEKGYVKVRRKNRWFWAPARKANLEELKAKLENIQ